MKIKGRVGGIKLNFNDTIDATLYVPYEDVKFLIEQIERVYELKQQIKRYREALEAIAYFDDKEEGKTTTRIDAKYIARKALEGEE